MAYECELRGGYQCRPGEWKDVPGYVYFIQAETGGPIKIGYASNPQKRLGYLQNGNPARLAIIGLVLAQPSVERFYHERFAAGRIRGEWFDPDTPGLAALLAEAASQVA